MIEPRYLNLSPLGTAAPSMATSLATSPSLALNLQYKYSVFDLLNLLSQLRLRKRNRGEERRWLETTDTRYRGIEEK